MTWTTFHDMHSGGGLKEDFAMLYVEAPEDEARAIFYNRFGHNPDRVSCACCGEDYSVSTDESLETASGYQRGCRYAHFYEDDDSYIEGQDTGSFARTPGEWDRERGAYVHNGRVVTGRYIEEGTGESYRPYMTLADYIDHGTGGLGGGTVKVIRADEITPEERHADIPAQGYVWAN